MFIIVNEYGVPQFYGYDEGCPEYEVAGYDYLVTDCRNPTEFETYEEAQQAIYFAEMENSGYSIKEVKQ